MGTSGETRKRNIICIGLVALAVMSRAAGQKWGAFAYNGIIFALYAAASFIWMNQINRRIMGRSEHIYLVRTVVMIIIWMALRTIKYDFTAENDVLARYLWYLYYVPQTLIVLFVFFSVLYVGMPEGKKISGYWRLLYIPAFFVIAGILTNDLHQQAFAFPDGLKHWNDGGYSYGPFYYIAMAWLILMFMTILIVAMIKCAVSAGRKKVWIPLATLAAAAVYFLLFSKLPEDRMILKMPEAISLIFAAFVESLIISHLIPSNDSYGDFWNASAIGAGIMDDSGHIQFKSSDVNCVDETLIRKAEKKLVMMENGRMALKSRKIQGGFGYWIRDVSEISAINSQMKKLEGVMSEENVMLKAENRLAEKKSRISQQEEIYKNIAERVEPQIMKINEILEAEHKDEADFEKKMKYACILNVYIKRYSNLILLSGKSGRAQIGELFLAIDESLMYVRLYGIKARGFYSGEGRTHCGSLLLVYGFFETIIEETAGHITGIMVDIDMSEETLIMKIEIDDPRHVVSPGAFCHEAEARGAMVDISSDGDTVYAILKLATGGEEA